MAAEFNEEFDEIRITEAVQREDGWTYLVELGHGEGLIEYLVDVDREYWTRLINRRVEPEKLVEITFKFLLDHQAKETIIKRFNLSDVSGQYPNYENEIKRLI